MFDEYRERVNAALEEILRGLSEDCPDRLREAMLYSLSAPGKRVRPILVLLASEAAGGAVAGALPAACAVEMVHTYSLIHDDLPAMDNDDYRRGIPTCHKQFDDATAILAGDALLTLAFETLARLEPADVAAACCAELASAIGAEGMVGGQMADMLAEQEGVGSSEALESIHRRKTGRLLCASVMIGGRVGGADATELAQLKRYGERVGLAFQIADDVLDVEGTAEKMGKAVNKDAGRGKLTYPAMWGVGESRRRAEALISEACGAVERFGEPGGALQRIARYMIHRDH